MNSFITFFITSTWLNLKKIIIKPTILLAFILLQSIGITMNLMDFSDNLGISIPVGIYGDISLNIQNPLIQIIAYTDREALTEDVISGTLNFGYVIDETIIIITTEHSFGYQIINELITAAILEKNVETMTINFLNFFFSEEDLESSVYTRIAYYRESDIFMQPYLTGTEASHINELNINEFTEHILKGIVGLIITAILIFIIPYFIKEKNSGVLDTLKYHKKTLVYYASLFTALFIVMFALGLLAMWQIDILSFAIYIFFCGSLAIFAIFLFKSSNIIQSFGIFLIILNIFALVDFSEISVMLGKFQMLFPLYWFLY